MSVTPLVTIYIPIYNGAKYFTPTLESLIHQTYSNLEIIIVNDGSTDSSLEIATAFAEKDSRIKIINHPKNLGLSAARNTGWQAASVSAKYLLNHDSDDISHSNKIERLVEFLEQNQNIDAVGCFCRYITANDCEAGFPPLEWRSDRIKKTFGIFNSMVVSATLVRREVFSVIGKFRAEYGGCDDYDFWSRMLLQGYSLANIPEFLHDIRIHSISFSSVNATAMEKQAQTIRDNYLTKCPESTKKNIVEKILHKALKTRMLQSVSNRKQ